MHIHNMKSGTSSLSAFSFLLAAGLVLAGLSIARGQNENNNGQNGNANRPVVTNVNGNGNRNGNGNVSTAPGNSNVGGGGGGTTTAPGGGQTPGTDGAGGGQAATGANDPNAVKVTKVEGELALFNTIKVTVQNLPALLKEAGNDYSKLVLYLDGYPLKGIAARHSAEANQLQFDIRQIDSNEETEETKKTRAHWNRLLGRPSLPIPRTKPVSVSVGLEGKEPIPTDVKQYPLTVINKGWYWAYVVVLIGLTVGLWYWAKNSDLLRVAKRPTEDQPQRYSLGFCQMAFWFYVVAASYVFIWMVTSEYSVFPAEVLALLGISAATALGASLINTSGPGETNPAVKPQPTKGFFNDITTDENEKVSFHRFQIVIWTLVLGIIFLFTIYNLLTMPKFPETLLALMGISSGTYIGFKFPEKKDAEARALAAKQGQNPPPGGGGAGGAGGGGAGGGAGKP